jgi:hypothetical protein
MILYKHIQLCNSGVSTTIYFCLATYGVDKWMNVQDFSPQFWDQIFISWTYVTPTIVIIIANNKEAGIHSSSVRRFVEQAPIIEEQSQREKRYPTRNMQAIRTNL